MQVTMSKFIITVSVLFFMSSAIAQNSETPQAVAESNCTGNLECKEREICQENKCQCLLPAVKRDNTTCVKSCDVHNICNSTEMCVDNVCTCTRNFTWNHHDQACKYDCTNNHNVCMRREYCDKSGERYSCRCRADYWYNAEVLACQWRSL